MPVLSSPKRSSMPYDDTVFTLELRMYPKSRGADGWYCGLGRLKLAFSQALEIQRVTDTFAKGRLWRCNIWPFVR